MNMLALSVIRKIATLFGLQKKVTINGIESQKIAKDEIFLGSNFLLYVGHLI